MKTKIKQLLRKEQKILDKQHKFPIKASKNKFDLSIGMLNSPLKVVILNDEVCQIFVILLAIKHVNQNLKSQNFYFLEHVSVYIYQNIQIFFGHIKLNTWV